MTTDRSNSSYGSILKASALIGGAQGISLLLGMVRVKFAAVLIGPLGVGLLGNLNAIQGLIGTIAGFGIQSSGVRDVAEAVGKGDQNEIGRTVLTLRRVCWLTGVFGATVIAAMSPWLSQWTFGSAEHETDIAMLGVIILSSNIAGGQMALIQGMRRIGDLARLNVTGAVAGTVITIGAYTWLGMSGIVPALLLSSLVQLAASWYFARRVPVAAVAMSWPASLRAAGGLARLGFVFMWNGLALSIVSYVTRALITHDVGLAAVGIFGSAFALSGMFVNFVLGAMGADYYPRLTAAAPNHGAMSRLVNEQTEVGLLLATPGLLATLSLSPWIIHVFYTSEFLSAIELLQWFILGCLGRVLSWPLGFVMLALNKGNWFFMTETSFNALHLLLIWLGLMLLGLEGTALAFFFLYVAYTAVVYAVGRHLIGFSWSVAAKRLLWKVLPVVIVNFIVVRLLPLWPATGLGLVFTVGATVFSLRGLIARVGPNHRLIQRVCQLPGARWAFGI